MRSKLLLLLLGFFIFLVFVGFSYVVHRNVFINFDFNTTVRLQDHISRKYDDFFSFLSLIGSFEIVGVFLLVVLIIRRKLKGIFVLLFFAGFHVLELYGKIFVSHPPPPHFMLRTKTISNFPQFYVSAENSYPSGHAARAIFVSIILILIIAYSKRLGKTGKLGIWSFILLYDVLMLVSRVYLGEHWFSDIAGGSLLGLATGLIATIAL